MHGILPIIPPRSNRKAPEHPDYRRYKDRTRVERMSGKFKQQRRIATRYDKTVLSFESFLKPRRRTPMAQVFYQHGLGKIRNFLLDFSKFLNTAMLPHIVGKI